MVLLQGRLAPGVLGSGGWLGNNVSLVLGSFGRHIARWGGDENKPIVGSLPGSGGLGVRLLATGGGSSVAICKPRVGHRRLRRHRWRRSPGSLARLRLGGSVDLRW